MNPRVPSLLVVGEALIDVVVHPDGHREEHPGGGPANVAITLGRLGHAPTLLTCLGRDAAGDRVREWLDDSGVTLDRRSLTDAPTLRAIAVLDDQGAADYGFDMRWDLAEVEPGPVDLLYVGSITATWGSGADRLVDQVFDRGLIVYDPNIRPSLIIDPDETRARIESLAARADIVKASDEDLAWIDPAASAEEAARRWLGGRTSVVVITHGADGVTGLTGQVSVRVGAERVRVVDTVGAGDTLMGAFIAGLVELGVLDQPGSPASRERLAALTEPELRELLRSGARAAAITVSRAGANPPRRAELPVLARAGLPSDSAQARTNPENEEQMSDTAAGTKLQLALDDIDREEVFPLLEQVADQVDIVEVGTPLIIRYGLELVSEIKRRHPGLTVLCDAKIMDAAYYEAELAFDAGADIVTILALTDDGSVVDAVRAAADHGKQIMADLICVPDLVARARQLQEMGVQIVAVHTGVDQQAQGRTPLDDLRALAAGNLQVPLAVAGGINCETAPDYLALGPSVLIVGGGITGATDPAAEAARMRQVIVGAGR